MKAWQVKVGAQRCNLSVLILGVREKLKLLESVCEARKSGCYVEKLPGKVRQQHIKVFGLTHGALGYTWFATFVHQLHRNNLVFFVQNKKSHIVLLPSQPWLTLQ